MQTKTIILNLINDNPGGLTLTEISQKTKLGENLSLIPTVAKRYVLELICNGLIQIDGKGGTYTITEQGKQELEDEFSRIAGEIIENEMGEESTLEICPSTVSDTPKTVTSRYAEMKQKLRNLSIKIKTI
jgi:predicted transcriptional regulator